MKCIFALVVVSFLIFIPFATAQDWKSSPYNWKNSPYNWENSPMRWDNERIIRDENGEPTGYAVPKRDGGVNFFDLEGKRRGYLPAED